MLMRRRGTQARGAPAGAAAVAGLLAAAAGAAAQELPQAADE